MAVSLLNDGCKLVLAGRYGKRLDEQVSETANRTGDGTEGARGGITVDPHGAAIRIALHGTWTVPTAAMLSRDIAALKPAADRRAEIDLAAVGAMDTAGAWLIKDLIDRYRSAGGDVAVVGLQDRHEPLLHIVEGADTRIDSTLHSKATTFARLLTVTGKGAIDAAQKARELTNFVGLVTVAFLRAAANPRRLRPISIVNQLELTGLRAIPIIGLLSFLIGVTLAYLMADQFRAYGLDVFTVNVLGIFVLREAGVLITAIVIAGRSGSAFTAEIGTMKVNEELDALRTLGIDPVEVLVVPRVLALLVTLPILAFWADLTGLLGGAVMTMLVLDLTPTQFIQQLKEAVNLDTFMVGLVKAPFHAYIIAVVGCFEGFKVKQSAESVGKQTTTAVVESIFLVIVATALFSVMFSVLGI